MHHTDKPVAPIHRESADIQYGYIKGYVNVTCEAEAEPPATFRWYRNNKHLHSRHHQIITGEHISILQVNEVENLIVCGDKYAVKCINNWK